MHEKAQDALCYVRKYGSADLFITMTCNPKWDEIQENLREGDSPNHRYDIITRVFRMKVKKLIDLLVKEKIFGAVDCYAYSIEWQKRGTIVGFFQPGKIFFLDAPGGTGNLLITIHSTLFI